MANEHENSEFDEDSENSSVPERSTDGNEADDGSSEEEAENVAAELMKDMPKPIQKTIHQMSMMQMSAGGLGPLLNPLFAKFKDGHIDKFLDYSQKDDENKFRYHCSNRWFKLGYVAIAVFVLLFILVFFSDDRELLNEILKVLVIFGGGFGTGYGFCSKKKE